MPCGNFYDRFFKCKIGAGVGTFGIACIAPAAIGGGFCGSTIGYLIGRQLFPDDESKQNNFASAGCIIGTVVGATVFATAVSANPIVFFCCFCWCWCWFCYRYTQQSMKLYPDQNDKIFSTIFLIYFF